MVSEKAWYLVAAGVLALGVSNGFVSQGENWMRSLVEKSIAVADGVSNQTMRLADFAETIAGRNDSSLARVEASVARIQTHVASVQTTMARRQADMARRQDERAHNIATQQMRGTLVICPRQDFAKQPPRLASIPTDGTF